MMYSVRKLTRGYGNTTLNILLFNLVITAILVWLYSIDYIIIFCSSTILHILVETGLAISKMRKGSIYVNGCKLPRSIDVLFRAMVEGPAFCVPAYFVAENFMAGQLVIGIAGSTFVVGIASLYMGLAEKRDLRRLAPGEEPMVSRRAMTKPLAVILLALINTGCLTALFLMPVPYRAHAFTYLIAYSFLVMLYYFINYNFGVRMVEIFDHDRKEYKMPGPFFQAAGLAYDSGYEMALLISPAYWLTFYLGLFHYNTIT